MGRLRGSLFCLVIVLNNNYNRKAHTSKKRGAFMEENNLGTSSTGINPTVAGLLCYLVGFVTGIIFLIIEKDNKFVRFHATQSVLTFGFLFVLQIVLPFIPFLGWALLWPLHIVTLVVWILLMMKAYKGEYYKLPIVGDMAEQKI